MSYLFNNDIYDWTSWGQVFHSIDAFELLIQHIFIQEKIPFDKIEQCKPGTNAVYKIGNYVIKIFAPKESGLNTESDYYTELFGMNRGNALCIAIPKLVAKGIVEDRYQFRYIIMDYIEGQALGDIEGTLSNEQKVMIGRELRCITDKMNTPCCAFNNIDIIHRELSNERWSIFPNSFNEERIKYLKGLILKNEVYVHGDLNPNNVLVGKNGSIYIIDFADALSAPYEYELSAIICDLFSFDSAYMKGYFADQTMEDITEICLKGLLVHDFGSNIIKDNLGNINEIISIEILKDKLYQAIKIGIRLRKNLTS